jgi:anti-anti-sigma factor
LSRIGVPAGCGAQSGIGQVQEPENSVINKNPGSRLLIVRPPSDLDAITAERCREQIHPLLTEGYRYVVFDFEAIQYVTSSGLGLLVEIYNHIARRGGSLRLVNCNERIEALLVQTKLDKVLRASADPLPLNLVFDELHTLLSQEALFSSRLHELTEALLVAESPQHTAALVLERIAAACGAEQGAIFLNHPEGAEMSLAGAIGLDAGTHAAAGTVSLVGNGLERTLMHAGEDSSVWRTLPGQPPEAPSRLQQVLGFERAILCCLKYSGRLQAFLLLREPDGWGREGDLWVPQLRLYCEISARFLTRAHRLARVEQEKNELCRRLLEMQKAHDYLVDVGKLAAMGTVISGVGHMLNNKLVPIIGYTQMLTQLGDLPEKTQHQLRTVNAAAVEMKEEMDQLIKSSRAREISPTSADINQILTQSLTLLESKLEGQGIRLRLQFEADLPRIFGDPDLLLQAFIVLIRRAGLSFDREVTERWIEIQTTGDGEAVEVLIQDNGRGLGSVSIDHWIDPLMPYIESASGTEFNFSIPRSVVRRHSGEMVLAERAGGGTCVRLVFPGAARDVSIAPVHATSQAES